MKNIGIKRYGETPTAGQRYRRRAGVYAVLFDGASVLLTHQAQPIPEYQLPGGGIDAGENPIPALHREVIEETGWHIAAPRHIGTYRRFTYMPEYDMHAEKVCAIYVARPVLRIGPPTEAGHVAVWASPNTALRILANEGDRAMLRRAINL
ncbi:MAG: NUDIX hydrolase [Cypionkella sp.]|nr:NUDIX hydrolase [Cypionkella sp.]